MLARLPLRSKLVLVVSVPLFVILGFAGFGITNRLGDLHAQRQYGHLRIPNDALWSLQRTLEHEGVVTSWYVAAKPDAAPVADLTRARDATDRSVRAVDAAGSGLGSSDVSAGTLAAWKGLETRLHDLDTLRRQADERAGLAAAFTDRYTSLDDNVLRVSDRVARDVDDRSLSDSMLGIVSLRRGQAQGAHEAMIVLPYLATGSSTQFSSYLAAVNAQDAANAAFSSSASPQELAAFERARRELPDDAFRAAVGNGATAFPTVTTTPEQYSAAWSGKQAAMTGAISAVQRVVDNSAADSEAAALRAVLGYGLGISTLVLLVLVLAWVMIRSVNRSLHSLTEAARDVAEVRLPHLVDTLQRGGDAGTAEPIHRLAVDSNDEIGALAEAFNTIQETTVRVAEEQAALLRKGIGDLYVNLARRNQSLVDRQIALLDVLEAHAEDPEQLGSLFELDHLATRMRRNAESLLVLSGAGSSRQWTEAIPILDVVRAASGEIADFARVRFVGFETDIAVAGNAVADVTHIIAELLENATAFSPPGSPVVVAGMLAERRFVVSITDEGIGMDEQRLATANALLQSPPPPGLSLSRTLGLFVVAHLARRYGIRVQLRRAATNGVTAIIAVPATVLTRVPDAATGTPAAPAAPPTAVTAPSAPAAPVVPTTSTATWDPDAALPPAGRPVAPRPEPAMPEPAAPEPATPAPEPFVAAAESVLTAPEGERVISLADLEDAEAPTVVLPAVADVDAPACADAPPAAFDVPVTPTAIDASVGWAEPEVIPPAFDPDALGPLRAVPADPPTGTTLPYGGNATTGPVNGHTGFHHDGTGLPRRPPGAAPDADESDGDALPHRSPGRHLSHRPAPAPVPAAEPDARPRPERVHDLLTRHLRGIRDGRSPSGSDVTTECLGDLGAAFDPPADRVAEDLP